MSLYTREIGQFLKTRNWPSKLVWTINELDDPAPHLILVFYRDNWITLPFEAQMQATEIVKEVMSKLNGDGIPTIFGKMEREIPNV